MAEFITLTPEERQRFAAYCRQHAASSRVLIEQGERAGGPVMEAWIRREVASMAAFTAVAEHLEMTLKYCSGCVPAEDGGGE